MNDVSRKSLPTPTVFDIAYERTDNSRASAYVCVCRLVRTLLEYNIPVGLGNEQTNAIIDWNREMKLYERSRIKRTPITKGAGKRRKTVVTGGGAAGKVKNFEEKVSTDSDGAFKKYK